MYSTQDTQEYLNYKTYGVKGSVTRGLVVSNKDPLFAGRVKVWIPTLHGGISKGLDIDEDGNFGLSDSGEQSKPGIETSGRILDGNAQLIPSAVDALPWAYVLGHNWGPTASFEPIPIQTNANHGIFNIPKVGTEVIVAFEQDNPNYPIVLGSVFHRDELLGILPSESLEIAPGIPIANTSIFNQNTYETEVANSYVIRSEKGSSFVITDNTTNEKILLYKKIPITAKSVLDPASYAKYSLSYPNFPNTATASFTITQTPVLSSTNSSSNSSSSGTSTSPTPTPTNTKITKRYPTTHHFETPSGGQVFGAPRAGHPHLGVDLGVPIGSELIAPIDCIPMYHFTSASIGLVLLIKGVDGYGQAFVHLSSINPEIILKIQNKDYSILPSGTSLGRSGNTGSVSSGPHIHWEVFAGADKVTSGEELALLRTCRNRGGVFKGETIPKYSCIDPLKWINGSGATIPDGSSVEVNIPADQIKAFVESSQQNSSKLDRVIGLQMSTVAGAETVFLRHPSGSFIGFDIDGNIQIFSVGDINVKVNRSVNADILGGIVTNCLAVYTRVRTVAKVMAKSILQLNWKDSFDGFPAISKIMDDFRVADMKNAIQSSSSNMYYLSPTTNTAVPASTVASTKRNTHLSEDEIKIINEKAAKITDKYDVLLAKYYLKHIKNSSLPDQIKNKLNIKLLKSIMVKESQGNPNAGSPSSVGLFQITPSGYSALNGNKIITDLNFLRDPEKNIDAGVHLLSKYAKLTYSQYTDLYTGDISDQDYTDLSRMTVFAYNVGIGTVTNGMSTITKDNKQINYSNIELYYNRVSTQANKSDHLKYVPQVETIYQTVQLSAAEADLFSLAQKS